MELIELPSARHNVGFKPRHTTLRGLIEAKMRDKGLRPSHVADRAGMDNGGMSRFLREDRGINAKTLINILKILDNITLQELRDL